MEGLEGRTLLSLPPIVTTGAAAPILATGATLNATVNPDGSTTAARFQYSTDPSFPLTSSTTLGAGFKPPSGVAVDGAGHVFVADYGNNRVVELSPPMAAASPASLTGTTTQPVTATLAGLAPGTTYYYRAVAANAVGTVADTQQPTRSFTTLVPPRPMSRFRGKLFTGIRRVAGV
jgi:hypothetical protein